MQRRFQQQQPVAGLRHDEKGGADRKELPKQLSAIPSASPKDDVLLVAKKPPREKVLVGRGPNAGRRRRRHAKQYRCCRCTAVGFRMTVGILALIALIPTLVLVILTYINSKNSAYSDWCSVLTGDETIYMGESGGVAGQRAQSYIQMHGNELRIKWDVLKQTGNISSVVQFAICGPLTTTDPAIALNCTALCGSPSTLACEGADPGEITGDIDALQPGSISPEPFIVAVRSNPNLYYPRMEDANGYVVRGVLVGCDRGT